MDCDVVRRLPTSWFHFILAFGKIKTYSNCNSSVLLFTAMVGDARCAHSILYWRNIHTFGNPASAPLAPHTNVSRLMSRMKTSAVFSIFLAYSLVAVIEFSLLLLWFLIIIVFSFSLLPPLPSTSTSFESARRTNPFRNYTFVICKVVVTVSIRID